jgi:dihydrofolate reductase
MGRNTWLSLPKKPLPNRLNIIVSNTKLDLPDGAIQTNNINHFKTFNNGWLIGGASLITSCWHLIDEIHLSRTNNQYTCDTFIDLDKIQQQFIQEQSTVWEDHTFEIWKRK